MLPDSGAGLRLRGVSTQPGQRKDGETPLNEGVGQRKERERKSNREGRKAKGKVEGRKQESKETKRQLILRTTQGRRPGNRHSPALRCGPTASTLVPALLGALVALETVHSRHGPASRGCPFPSSLVSSSEGLTRSSSQIRAWARAGVILFPKDWLSWQSSWYY